MTRKATERCLAKRSAHATRAAAIRLAPDRAGQDVGHGEAHGCVDWFPRAPQEEVTTELLDLITGEQTARGQRTGG